MTDLEKLILFVLTISPFLNYCILFYFHALNKKQHDELVDYLRAEISVLSTRLYLLEGRDKIMRANFMINFIRRNN